jgi:GH25 family lysozyme M1 (1,4-beta-N-acetylmuramidase)
LSRRKIAKERGYLWGAYHLGYTGNVEKQVDLFLSLIGDDENTLMVLDLEDTNNGRFMTITEAQRFMDLVFERTGKIPVVYANHSTTRLLNSRVKNNILFKQAKLWYARFKSSVTDFPIGVWNNYFLWQFSSEINCSRTGTCLYNVPGTRFDMDVNVFYGDASELESRWHNY